MSPFSRAEKEIRSISVLSHCQHQDMATHGIQVSKNAVPEESVLLVHCKEEDEEQAQPMGAIDFARIRGVL